GVVTYRPERGEPYFALQLQVKLEAGPRRPRDILVAVATTAGQTGAAWTASRQLAEAALKRAGPQDRVSLWGLSAPEAPLTRCLPGGFFSPTKEPKKVEQALAELAKEYPAGGADLGAGLQKMLDSFDGRAEERQRVLLDLGDGLSAQAPLGAAARVQLARK